MQLGDWVSFSTIVVKEQTAFGNRPATQALRRIRKGVVVGERPVYEVESGVPPTLSNRQTVLLVAVSLHRHYRVLPGDAQPATPPRSRRRNIQQPVPSQPVDANAVLSAGAVATHVADYLARNLQARPSFYSCDVAQAIRAVSPGLVVQHDDVRRALDDQLAAQLASGDYTLLTGHCAIGRVCAHYVAA